MTALPEKFGGAPHSKLSLRLWLRLLTCTSIIEKRVRNRLRRDFNSTLPRFDVLATLDHAGKPITMGELSSTLMVSNGNVTGIVSRLEEEGLIERLISPADRRTHHISLTEAGKRDFDAMAATHEGWIDDMFVEMSESEIAELLETLDQVRRSLSKDKGEE